jgi:hypothetical protein
LSCSANRALIPCQYLNTISVIRRLGKRSRTRLPREETPPPSRLEEIAAATARPLLLDTEKWIHRRVERVTYTDRELLKWHFSVDFTINEGFVPFVKHVGLPDEYYVPVALLRKWPPLMNLDVRDEGGCPIPLLTAAKNRAVDAAALAGLVPPDASGKGLEALFKEIAHAASVKEADLSLARLAAKVKQMLPSLSQDEADDWLRIVVLATNFAWNSLLWVRVRSVPRQRQLVKVGFEAAAPAPGPLRRRLRSTLGVGGEWIRLDLHNLGERGSYHLEFVPPPGTDVLEARLHVRDPLSVSKKPKWYELKRQRERRKERRSRREKYSGPATKRRFRRSLRSVPEQDALPGARTAYTRNLVSRAHLYVAESSGQSGRAHILIAPTRREFLTGALYASVLTTALLWFSWGFAPALVEEHHEAPTVTALLLLPVLLSYLFTQPIPSPVARRMIAGVRILTRTVTLLPVIAALVMLGLTNLDRHGNTNIGLIEDWWLGLAIAASVLSLMLGITAKLLPRSRVGELYASF